MVRSLNQKIKAVICMLIACFCFSSMSALMNYGASRISAMQHISLRGLIDSVLTIPILLTMKVRLFGNNPVKLMTRGSLGVFSAMCIFWSCMHMPIANAAALFRTTPLIMPLIANLVLKEKIKKMNLIFCLSGFIGVLFILRPQPGYLVSYAGFIALLGAFITSFAFVTLKHLTSRENSFTIMLYFFMLSFLIPLILKGNEFVWLTNREMYYISLIGILGFVGQLALTTAFHSIKASVITPWTYTEIIISALYGYILLNQKIDYAALIGMIIIFFSVLFIVSNEA